MSNPAIRGDGSIFGSDTMEGQERGALENQDETQSGWRFPWRKFWSEFVGTALLLLAGLSVVIFMFGEGSRVAAILPNMMLRRVISGFVFGSIGASIALSLVGKESGAHINPVVTMGFWLAGRLNWRDGLAYVTAQLAGASVGCLPLLAWGSTGQSISFGATVPGKDYSILAAIGGELVTTFAMVTGLSLFLAFRNIRNFTPAMFPFLYAVMVPLEAPRSREPARIPRAPLVRQSFQANGGDGGSTGSVRWSAPSWRSSSAVALRNESRSQSYTTSTPIAAA